MELLLSKDDGRQDEISRLKSENNNLKLKVACLEGRTSKPIFNIYPIFYVDLVKCHHWIFEVF